MQRAFTVAVTLALVAGALGTAPTVLAAAPANDNFASAAVIATLPFSDVVDNTEATTEADEPQACYGSPRTVWYTITPAASGVLRADMAGSGVSNAVLAVWQATSPGLGGLSYVGCLSWGGSVTFAVVGGATYYLQAGDGYTGGGALHVNLQLIPPPPNDDFASATVITSLPFSESEDASYSTNEPGEPSPSCASFSAPTVWFAFTPPTTATMSAFAGKSGYLFLFAVYSGSSLASLDETACGIGGITFRAEAGVTYHFQVLTDWFLDFRLEVTPPPNADFYYYPGDPTPFDTVQFYDSSYDPGGIQIESRFWDFGDGSTSTAQNPTHSFAADGDYTVQLSVTTYDGRTGSVSKVVKVATHDVAITKLLVPTSASAGQTRQIAVGLSNARYPETVQVQLFKSNSSGLALVGTLTQSVPVRPMNRTTAFTFNYTFTKNDATLGKVTFRAEATIQGYRDALPADNMAIGPPTKVTK